MSLSLYTAAVAALLSLLALAGCGGAPDALSPAPTNAPTPPPPGLALDNPHPAGSVMDASNGLRIEALGVLPSAPAHSIAPKPDHRHYVVELFMSNDTGSFS